MTVPPETLTSRIPALAEIQCSGSNRDRCTTRRARPASTSGSEDQLSARDRPWQSKPQSCITSFGMSFSLGQTGEQRTPWGASLGSI